MYFLQAVGLYMFKATYILETNFKYLFESEQRLTILWYSSLCIIKTFLKRLLYNKIQETLTTSTCADNSIQFVFDPEHLHVFKTIFEEDLERNARKIFASNPEHIIR